MTMKSAATEKNKASNINVVSDNECLRELVDLTATGVCATTDFFAAALFTVDFFVVNFFAFINNLSMDIYSA